MMNVLLEYIDLQVIFFAGILPNFSAINCAYPGAKIANIVYLSIQIVEGQVKP